MNTRAILMVALLLPVAAQAEDMFKWRDARGRIHYSNDTEKVPAGAQTVTKQLGAIGGEPIGEAVAAPAAAEPTAASERSCVKGEAGCLRDMGLWPLPRRAADFYRERWFAMLDGRPAPGAPTATDCARDLKLGALPNRGVDFDRRGWFDVDYTCGRQHDIESWLRDATTTLELRKIGF